MDYLGYFGLASEPFAHAPAPKLYFGSRQHSAALQRLMHTVATGKGLAVLLGDIGHGKTTLARRLLDALPPRDYEAAMLVIVHGGITASWLLKRIASQLGVKEPADHKLDILAQLYERLRQVHAEGRRAVVLIDEAQMLATREIMEEFRGLLNIEVPGQKLISFIFFGLPELEQQLALDPPLAQRVTMRYRLRPLDAADTAAYVQHRLRGAGGLEAIFDASALEVIHEVSRGVPRVINTLCDNVLLELFFARQRSASGELVGTVAEQLGLFTSASPPALQPKAAEPAAVPGSPGEDAVAIISRDGLDAPAPAAVPPLALEPQPIETPTSAIAEFGDADMSIEIDAPASLADVVSPAPTFAAAAPQPAAPPAVESAPAAKKTINLAEIDALLADIAKLT